MRLEDATVLLVDDLAPVRELFSVWLSRKGCAVLHAQNGMEALRLLTTQQVDAIISDVDMPILNGLMLAERVAELGLRVPVLLISGFADIEPRVPFAIGVEAILMKPVARQELVAALQLCLTPRAEMWATPLDVAPEHTVATAFDAAECDGGQPGCGFLLGRGGCAFLASGPLARDTAIGLQIDFRHERRTLSGQARVRWTDARSGWVGVEFLYLEPSARDWVAHAIDSENPPSYIPSPTRQKRV